MSEDNENKKIFKLVQKENPPEETPGETPDALIETYKGQFESLILVGWKEDHFKIAWSKDFTPEEVFLQLELAKTRIMANIYSF